MNLDENLPVTLGGGFFGGILIGYALKKIIKIVAIIAGFFLAALAYLQYQQIANINWDRLQAISEDTLTTLANATQQIPGFDGNGNISAELVMTNLGIPLTLALPPGVSCKVTLFIKLSAGLVDVIWPSAITFSPICFIV
jgi:uncharacterized membrane protein (Fun14 family)